MNLKNIEINILKFKLAKESSEIVKEQFNEGLTDLTNKLTKFRKKLSSKEQVKSFDKRFFNKHENTEEALEKISLNEPVDLNDFFEEKSKHHHPQWIKKLYKQIVFITHPDKFVNFPIEHLKFKFVNIYKATINALEMLDYSMIILSAYELDIKVDNKDAIKFLKESTIEKEQTISGIKILPGYQWYHFSENDKELFLSNYLKQLGYIFTKQQVKEVLKNVRKRKTGTRPEKTKRVKSKKMN